MAIGGLGVGLKQKRNALSEWDPRQGPALGDGCHRGAQGLFVATSSTFLKMPEIYQFLNVGSIKKENVQAKQNKSLGQIWLKGSHSAVSGSLDNNS